MSPCHAEAMPEPMLYRVPQVPLAMQVDPAEVRFLILRFLDDGRCPEAVQALAQQLQQADLLPRRTDVFGEHPKRVCQLRALCMPELCMRAEWPHE